RQRRSASLCGGFCGSATRTVRRPGAIDIGAAIHPIRASDNLVPTRPRRRPRNRSRPVSDYDYEDDDEDDTKPLPQRPATVLSVLLRAAAKLHLLDFLPGHGAVQAADVSARRPQVGRRSAVQAFVAEITDRLDRPVAAVRSDGAA